VNTGTAIPCLAWELLRLLLEWRNKTQEFEAMIDAHIAHMLFMEKEMLDLANNAKDGSAHYAKAKADTWKLAREGLEHGLKMLKIKVGAE
jgi:hypothetical protein